MFLALVWKWGDNRPEGERNESAEEKEDFDLKEELEQKWGQ